MDITSFEPYFDRLNMKPQELLLTIKISTPQLFMPRKIKRPITTATLSKLPLLMEHSIL